MGTNRSEVQLHTARIYNRARSKAVKDVIDLHRPQYELLLEMYISAEKKAIGWVDLRMASPREKEDERRRRTSDEQEISESWEARQIPRKGSSDEKKQTP